jgi:plastocyanin
MRRVAWMIGVAVAMSLVATACGGGGDEGDGGGGGDGTTLTAPAGAATDGFAEGELTAGADAAFTIHFVNDDPGVPHNVQIFEGTSTEDEPAWAPPGDATITGPDEVDYDVPALAAGAYTFNCLTHPTTMTGTLTIA